MRTHALPRQCAEPGCSGRTFQGSRCQRHARVWVGGQPSSGYGARWARLRAQVLAEEPQCRLCGAPATEVDHIQAKAFGGTDDRSNLQALDTACHKRKTAADSRLGKARKDKGVVFSRVPASECTSPATKSAAVQTRKVEGA
jgi:5-methylcytosine-specific restriction protein A